MTSIEEKVAKLLSLTSSANEHEAALAATKAAELIDQYNLDRSKLKREEREPIELQTIWKGKGRATPVYIRALGVAVKHLFSIVPVNYQGQGEIRGVGRATSLSAARETLAALALGIENSLTKRRRSGELSGRQEISAYRHAAALVIVQRAKEFAQSREDANNETTALVRSDYQAARDAMSDLCGPTQTGRRRGVSLNIGAAFGEHDGKGISLGVGGRLGGRLNLP